MGLLRTLGYIRQRRRDMAEELARQRSYCDLELELLAPHLTRPLQGSRALDIGCGQMLPMLIGLNAQGCEATGIDLDPYLPGQHSANFWRRRREGGLASAASAAVRNIAVDDQIGRRLAVELGYRKPLKSLDVRVMNVCALDFPDNTFDLMTSLAVFEHIEDMPGTLREIHRALKPGAPACLHAHLFASFTGGHNCDIMDTSGRHIGGEVDCWDHLRANRHTVPVYLNKLKLAEFRQLIEDSPLELAAWHAHPPSESDLKRLTPEIETELTAKGYTREDLLTTSLHMIVRKPQAG
ncbi:MAG: class I SAM-dependent methyltransferase [Armatimonadetes bacterium]|nr:class I SAM-dependent methyltransferase [Armatimonadota bacterium]